MAHPVSGEVQGFRVYRLRFDETSKVTHHILWKPHAVRKHNEAKPAGRTLYVINLPPFVTKDSLKHLFSFCGKVTDVYLQEKPTNDPPIKSQYPNLFPDPIIQGFAVAYVVFTHPSAVQKAMNLNDETIMTLSTKEHPVETGMALWKREYNQSMEVNEASMIEEARVILQNYDADQEKEKMKSSEEPDDEGWVTVSSSRKTKKPILEKVDNLKGTNKKKKKKKPIVKLYAFQYKEDSMEKIAHMRKKLEEDKKRIAIMKATRKFKPM